MGFFSRKNVAESTIKVNYDGKEAQRGLSSLGKTVKTLAASVGGLLIFQKVNSLIQESTELAKIQIQAEAGLAQALGKTSRELLTHASALQKVTTFGDESIIQAQTLVAAFIKEELQIKKLTPAILDLAAAKGMDLRTAADLVTKSVASSTNALSRYGIQIEGAAGSTERIDNAVRELNTAFGGMAEALAETDVGKLEQMANELGDIKEELGKEILPLQVEWNRLLLEGSKIAGKFLLETIEGWRAILGSTEDQNEEAEEAANKVKKYKEQVDLWTEAVENANGEFVKSPFSGRNIKLTTAENRIEHFKQKIIETNDEFQKLVGEKPLPAQKTKLSPVDIRKPKKDLSDSFPVYEGFQIGLKQREKAAKDSSDRMNDIIEKELEESEELQNEYIEQRKIAFQTLNNLTMTETEIRLQDELRIIDEWKEKEIISTVEHEQLKIDIEKRASEERLAVRQREQREKVSIAQKGLSSASTINNSIMQMIELRTQREIQELESLGLSEEEFAARKVELMEEGRDQREAFARVNQGIAIAEAWINVYKAATGAFADTPGGALTRGLAMGAAIAQGALTVASIQTQNFETGVVGLNGIRTTRQRDNTLSAVGDGESIIGAPQTSMHEETLRAINNNTANTARGVRSMNSSVVNHFHGLSTEQVLSATIAINRKNLVGRKI